MAESLESLHHDENLIKPPAALAQAANVPDYEAAAREAAADVNAWWAKWAARLEWSVTPTKGLERSNHAITWFADGRTNISHNCLDRHVNAGRGAQAAFRWTGEDGVRRELTWEQVLEGTNRLANALASLGVAKGDRCAIYMPLVPEIVMAMQACARIGAPFTVVFGGFSEKALASRMEDCGAKVLITADLGYRRGKTVDLIGIARRAAAAAPCVQAKVVLRRAGTELLANEHDWAALCAAQSAACPAEQVEAEHPLFFLYTSGTTGKPKGVLHTHGGYMVQTFATCKMVFDLKDSDIFWCTADPGWITGHSYIVFGPMLAGVTQVIAEGAPDYPDPGRFWKIVQDEKVTVFYTAPTAVRMFMRHGESFPAKYDMKSLRLLGSVGEPINPEAWHWYHRNIGGGRCPIVDTWWQTETGAILLTTLPSFPMRPGSAGKPIPGLDLDVVDHEGKPVAPGTGGFLCVRAPWPSLMRTIYGDHPRYEKYWTTLPGGVYTAGDVAVKDKDGYIMVLGRSDDVIKVAGHRIGTAEVESALVAHDAVAEAAVVGKPDEVKGERIKAFVILCTGHTPSEELKKSIFATVRQELGPVGVPSELDFVPSLPKTRSGKIMRRVLKARELGVEPGDISTLED